MGSINQNAIPKHSNVVGTHLETILCAWKTICRNVRQEKLSLFLPIKLFTTCVSILEGAD